MSTIHANDPASFQREVIESTVPVVVDFWAEWCGPCRTIAPELDALARDYGQTIKVVKVDVDKNQAVAAQYGVRSIPMIGLFEQGALTKHTIGARPRRAIESDLGLTKFLVGAWLKRNNEPTT